VKFLLRLPFVGRFILFFYRWKILLSLRMPSHWQAWRWLFVSRETTNFTYELDDLSRAYLVDFIALATNCDVDRVEAYIREIEQDEELRGHILHHLSQHPDRYKSDRSVLYARRVGWYALVRILRPRVVIETGIDKGLGCCVLCAALRRNAAEGDKGHHYGTDINPAAGYLLQAPYKEFGTILYGDSIESLKKIDQPVDLFINDSDHSAEYEAREYEVILPKMSEKGIIVSDNAELADSLHKFSRRHRRQFLFWRETPKAHWFAGAGIGISLPVKQNVGL